MFYLRKPTAARLDAIRNAYHGVPYSYREIGQTRGPLPSGYNIDHHRRQLGTGAETFARASRALRAWRGFQIGWVEPCWPEQTIEVDALAGTLVRVFGLWTVNVCRIVYLIDEPDEPVARFGFAYGTLQGHAEQGEERFTIEWDRDSDTVSYDILAFSILGRLLTRIAKPLARRFQKRFALGSMQALTDGIQP